MKPEEFLQAEFNQYQQTFRQQKRVRIENVFTEEYAERLFTELSENTVYNTAFLKNNQVVTLPQQYFQQISAEQKKSDEEDVYRHARRGVGFHYQRRHLFEVMIIQPVFMAFFQWLNSPSMLSGIEQLTGSQGLKSASAQATRYVPGSFLTAHHDVNPEEDRRIAYVFNFAQNWRPDWGGLLQFFDEGVTSAETWIPLFNSLVLFEVQLPHAVTYVTPFAGGNRFAITGWFNGQ